MLAHQHTEKCAGWWGNPDCLAAGWPGPGFFFVHVLPSRPALFVRSTSTPLRFRSLLSSDPQPVELGPRLLGLEALHPLDNGEQAFPGRRSARAGRC